MRNESLSPESIPSGLEHFVPKTTPATSSHAPGTLVDKYGRHITYIRLSITDRCDFRCFYCMAEEMEFLPRDQVLSLEECLRIVRTFVDMGVTKVRITGGEPLVRRNAMWLLQEIGRPVLVGTWRAATWAIDFYARHGFRLVDAAEKTALLRKYWTISERQNETSVVLAQDTLPKLRSLER